MDEIVKTVSQKTGLSEEMAKTAVEAVLDYLKSRLPAPIAGQVDSVVRGEGGGGMAGMMGGLFGKK